MLTQSRRISALLLVLTGLLAFRSLPANAAPSQSEVSAGGADLRGTALIYRGPGSCEGCPESAAAIAEAVGLTVTYIAPKDITPARLSSARVVIYGGGEDSVTLRNALSDDAFQALRAYVHAGGRYWGICNGAYFAGATLDDAQSVEGLRLFDGETYDHSPYRARTEIIRWNGTFRRMYVQEAPAFDLITPNQAHIIATYDDGAVAAFQARSGRGWIALTGPHPEATQDWLAADGLTDPDLAPTSVAEAMLKDLLTAPPAP